MDLDKLKQKLSSFTEKDIIITDHAKIQAIVREIDLKEVKQNIIKPEKLVYAKEQKSKKSGEDKYDCYFAYSRHLYHRYVLTINRKVIIVTIIKINRDWQKAIG
jgi:predicted transcriptional regulator